MRDRGIVWCLVLALVLAVAGILHLSELLRTGLREAERSLEGPPGQTERISEEGREPQPGAPEDPSLTSVPSEGPHSSSTSHPQATPAQAKLGDIVMVGVGGVERIVARDDGAGGVAVKINYRNASGLASRPDVEVVFHDAEGLQIGGLRVSWWLSTLPQGATAETFHTLEIDPQNAHTVHVRKPRVLKEVTDLSAESFLRKGTWVYHGKEIIWVLPSDRAVRVVEEVTPLADQERVNVAFEELVAEYRGRWDTWEFLDRRNLESLGAITLSRATEGAAFELGWSLVQLEGEEDPLGWVKSEQIIHGQSLGAQVNPP